MRERGLDAEVAPTPYARYAQAVPPNEDPCGYFFLVVRTPTDAIAYRQPIEAIVHRLDADLPIANVQTLDARLPSRWRGGGLRCCSSARSQRSP